MSNEESDSSDIEQPMEPDFPEASEHSEGQMNELPDKSREQYQNTYRKFIDWKDMNHKDSLGEDVMLEYFRELADKVKPPTLWTQFSMLKHTISLYDRVDITNFKKLRNFLKKKSVGYQSKTTKVFTSKEIEKFLNDAPDNQYLPEKVTLIFGIIGACKNQELVNLTVDDIEDDGTMALVKIPKNENNAARSFTVCGEFYKMYKKYAVLRPKKVDYKRFFLNYRYGKCFNQAIGHNKFNLMPKQIAAFLNLPNPDEYKANSFRRTSAMLLAHSGADVKTIQRHGGWTPKIAKDVIAETKRKQIELSTKITDSVFLKPSTSSSSTTNFEGEGSSEGSSAAAETKRGEDPLFIDCSSDTEEEESSTAPGPDNSQDTVFEKTIAPPVVNPTPPSASSSKATNKAAVHSQFPPTVQQKRPGLRTIPQKLPERPQKVVPQESSEVCLRWGHYHMNMQTSFPSLLNSEEFVDVTLACEGKSIKCHKVILSSCSDYLATLLRENPCQHPIILMKDLKFWEIEALVRFMYKGEVNISHDKLAELLNAADALQIKGLVNSDPAEMQNPSVSTPQPSVPRCSPATAQKSSEPSKLPTNQKRGTKRVMESNELKRMKCKSPRQGPETPPPRALPPEIKLESLDISLPDVDILLPNNDDSSTSNYENLMAGNEDDPGGEESLDSDMQFDFHGSENMADVHMDLELTEFLGEEHDEEVDDDNGEGISEDDPGDDEDDEVWIVEDET
ncbi:uncharacterized protein LOC107040041 [Diachasma alloeum]|uniref:uncharacterized protein LOC107040041 n=1 Tax=Diachasma alloeum TaxID=454923 RepID=UPI00073822C4|nr:uncharacterized protein LOC107040041 [Diachasma alloeum]